MGITRTLWRTSSLYIREDLNVDATEDNLDEKKEKLRATPKIRRIQKEKKSIN
jgi:hypothetical protein